jgi:hypothetical protein
LENVILPEHAILVIEKDRELTVYHPHRLDHLKVALYGSQLDFIMVLNPDVSKGVRAEILHRVDKKYLLEAEEDIVKLTLFIVVCLAQAI